MRVSFKKQFKRIKRIVKTKPLLKMPATHPGHRSTAAVAVHGRRSANFIEPPVRFAPVSKKYYSQVFGLLY